MKCFYDVSVLNSFHVMKFILFDENERELVDFFCRLSNIYTRQTHGTMALTLFSSQLSFTAIGTLRAAMQ